MEGCQVAGRLRFSECREFAHAQRAYAAYHARTVALAQHTKNSAAPAPTCQHQAQSCGLESRLCDDASKKVPLKIELPKLTFEEDQDAIMQSKPGKELRLDKIMFSRHVFSRY